MRSSGPTYRWKSRERWDAETISAIRIYGQMLWPLAAFNPMTPLDHFNPAQSMQPQATIAPNGWHFKDFDSQPT